jgi:hypothetical protein
LKKLLVFLICGMMFINNPAFSQARPVSKMQSAVSGVVQQKSLKRGFAANDPRFIETIKDMGTTTAAAAAGAATVTALGVTAPAWATVAISAGIATVVGYAVSLAIDGITKWLFGDSTIDEVGNAGEIDPSNGISVGAPYWTVFDNSTQLYGGDGFAISMQAYHNYYTKLGTVNPSAPTCTQANASTIKCGPFQATRLTANSTRSCPKGEFYSGTKCSPYTFKFPAPGTTPTVEDVPPATAVSHITAGELAKELNPDVVAGVANAAWRNAASQPGYDGLPYSPADPITPAEVAQWKNANPTRWPTVGDFVAPQPATNDPWSIPFNPTAPTQNPSTNPSSGTNPSTEPQSNLGVDPAIGAPGLEEPPTAEQILAPVLNLLPGFDNFSVPSHSMECPKPVIEVFDKQFVMDAQCDMAEKNRQVIQSLMLAVWSLWGVFIILKA